MKTFIEELGSFERDSDVEKEGPTITISGLAGSGKSTAAKSIAKATGFKLISAGSIFREVADERDIPLDDFSEVRTPEIDHEIDKRTLKYAMRGNVVLDGRLSGFVAGDWADLRILMRCPLKVRAQRVAKRDDISVPEATDRIKKRDKADSEAYEDLYEVDLRDRSIYDLVINNERLSYSMTQHLPGQIVEDFLSEINENQG